jgi:predicted membrane protein
MNNKNLPFLSSQFIFGILIIAVGVVFMLDNLQIVDAGTVLYFWPAILIIFGASKAAQSTNRSGQIFGFIFIAIGALMLLDRMDIIDFRIWDWWPVVLIIVGLNFLRGARSRSQAASQPFTHTSASPAGEDGNAYIRNTALMSGVKRNINSKEFRGGEISALMGGCEIDLREAEMKGNEAVLDVNIIMGGLELRVPMGWTVVVASDPHRHAQARDVSDRLGGRRPPGRVHPLVLQ